MTDEERRIVEKLKALIADTPYKGEKQTALNVLKNYCLKHNISEEELNEPEEKTFEYEVDKNGFAMDIFHCVAFWFFNRKGKSIRFNEIVRYYTYMSEEHKNLSLIRITCKPYEFVELIAEFEQYNSAFKKQLRRFLKKQRKDFGRAFLDKNSLLLPCDYYKRIGKEKPIDFVKAFMETGNYLNALNEADEVEIYKQISHGRKP